MERRGRPLNTEILIRFRGPDVFQELETHQLLLPSADQPIAFTGCALETVPVGDPDPATAMLDQSTALENSDRNGDSRPAHAEHLSEEDLGELEVTPSRTVLRQEEPSSTSFFRDMHTVACG
jgi:hypothetical protein